MREFTYLLRFSPLLLLDFQSLQYNRHRHKRIFLHSRDYLSRLVAVDAMNGPLVYRLRCAAQMIVQMEFAQFLGGHS